jgi:hypothetical protein
VMVCAIDVSLIATETACPTPERVTVLPAPELPALATVERPVAFVKSTVAELVTIVTCTFSILVSAAGVTDVLMTATSSSVPEPPLSLSPEFKV